MNDLASGLNSAAGLLLGADSELWSVVALSLRVSGTACLIGAAVGLTAGAWLAIARFPGHALVVGLLNTLLALPSVVVGLVVYLLLSRAGPLGELGILFTPAAMVIAQSILVVPLVAALARRLVLLALAEGGDQLRSLGAGRFTTAVLLLLHERFGVLTVLLTAFGRAIAEVGAALAAATPLQWVVLVGLGLFGTGGHLLLILAFQLAPASTLMPFVYTQIASATLVGWWIFGHLPDAWGWLGMAIIALSGATSVWLNLRDAAPARQPPSAVAADTIAD